MRFYGSYRPLNSTGIRNGQYYAFVSQMVGSTYAAVGNFIYFCMEVVLTGVGTVHVYHTFTCTC